MSNKQQTTFVCSVCGGTICVVVSGTGNDALPTQCPANLTANWHQVNPEPPTEE